MFRSPLTTGFWKAPGIMAAALGVVVFGAACGSDSPQATSGSDASAIEAELGFGTREFGLTDSEWTTAVETTQAEIAKCMAEAGFEYIPAGVDTVELAMKSIRSEPGMTAEEYKQQWGFGKTTRFDNRAKEIELGEQNLAIYDSLSEADQIAYDRTLYGEDSDATFSFQFDEEDFEPVGGCTLKAIQASFTAEQLDPNYVHPKDILVEMDGRVAAAELAWIDCMGEAGYDYEDQDEIIEEYGDRLDELLGDDDPEDLSGARLEALAQLQAEEIAAALADYRCGVEHVDQVVRDVEVELFGKVVSG
ncbi:MAG: hypothetical protein HKN03_05935 [Acidimicrobiales bacterium]|nr:hypothetical protein [Acidimicrobiales bacterium]